MTMWGSRLADMVAVPMSISSTMFWSFPKQKGPTVPHWSVFQTSTSLISETLKHCETLHKPYGCYGHGVETWPRITVSWPWDLRGFFQREDLLTWHKIHEFCCANVGRFSHSTSGFCLFLVCHVSSKYLNNRHFSQCKWNTWLRLTNYMHQNRNIASSKLLMNQLWRVTVFGSRSWRYVHAALGGNGADATRMTQTWFPFYFIVFFLQHWIPFGRVCSAVLKQSKVKC